jgi:hypothetical protein
MCDCCNKPIINGGDCGEICKERESVNDINDIDDIILNYNNKKYKLCDNCDIKIWIQFLKKMEII